MGNKQMRQIRYRLCAAVLTLALLFGFSVVGGIEAYGESVGSTQMSGTVIAPDSTTDDSDTPENTDTSSDDGVSTDGADASGTQDSGSLPTASGGARTGDVARAVFYSLPLIFAAAAAGILVRRRGCTAPSE
ncbi:MAG: hypothetical protein LUF32_00475 [Clostridiales bacterium]|nr:hypothetical protein [Clostridiales bacterium]